MYCYDSNPKKLAIYYITPSVKISISKVDLKGIEDSCVAALARAKGFQRLSAVNCDVRDLRHFSQGLQYGNSLIDRAAGWVDRDPKNAFYSY